MSDSKWAHLIGRKLIEVLKTNGGGNVTIYSRDDNDVVFRSEYTAVADCCSSSWVESIDSEVIPGEAPVITKVVDELIETTQHGELKIYASTILTTRGRVVIGYRNESNGYYGGSLELTSIECVADAMRGGRWP